jgi:hypothetical protein
MECLKRSDKQGILKAVQRDYILKQKVKDDITSLKKQIHKELDVFIEGQEFNLIDGIIDKAFPT